MRQKLKKESILFAEHSSDMSGGQAVFLELISAALSSGADVTVAFPFGGNLETSIRKRFGLKVKLLNIPEVSMNNGSKSIKDLFKFAISWIFFIRFWHEFSYSRLWYVNGGRVLFPMVLASILYRRKIAYHAHISHKKWAKRLLILFIKCKAINTIICPSLFIQKDFFSFSRTFLKECNVIVIPNSLGLQFYNLPFQDRFANRKIKNIGVFGKITPLKGQDLVCEVADLFPDIVFYCIGSAMPNEDNYLEKLKLTAPYNVRFISEVSNVAKSIKSLDIQICLVPSKLEESFGLAAIEGMAASSITISSYKGGLIEIAENTGMITFNNREEFIEKLNALLNLDSHSLSKMAKEQYDKTIKEYSIHQFSAKAKSLFKSLLQ